MLSPNSLRAILFDLDGTLRHNIPEGGNLFTDHVVSLGLTVHEEDRLRAKRWEHYYFANSPEIQADELAPQMSLYMRENYKPQVHVPVESRALLSTLKEAGFILGVVSNRENIFAEELNQMELAHYFHFTLAGGEVKSFKPAAGIFEEALRRAGTSASETMYIGDNYFADVVGSLRAGLRAVLYDPNGVFPEAQCEIIQSFDQLPKLL